MPPTFRAVRQCTPLERLHSPVSSVDYATAEHLSRLTPHRSVVFVSGNALLGHTPILKRATAYPLTVQLAILTECKLISQLAPTPAMVGLNAQLKSTRTGCASQNVNDVIGGPWLWRENF